MPKVRILKVINLVDNKKCLILETNHNNYIQHSHLEVTIKEDLPHEDIELTDIEFNDLSWLKYQEYEKELCEYNLTIVDNYGYNLNDSFKFGMYEGYQVGIVYMVDPAYIEWCLLNIDDFNINDIEILTRFGVINVTNGYQALHDFSYPINKNLLDKFVSPQNLLKAFGMSYLGYNINLLALKNNVVRRQA